MNNIKYILKISSLKIVTKYKRLNLYNKLVSYYPANEILSLEKRAILLKEKLGKDIINKKVLVAYGGGKDSSYTLAYVRLLQLSLFKKFGETFKIRISTNRHAGMPQAVMENIHRVYTALDLYESDDIELLMIDGHQVKNFDKDQPIPEAIKFKNRKEILMSGHRTQGDGRPTFCNACNLSMANSFGLAAWYRSGVDVIITGDSKKEQRDYYIWVKRLALQLGINNPTTSGFRGFLSMLNGISKKYFEDIFGKDSFKEISDRHVADGNSDCDPTFFSIYEHTNYDAGAHWELLTEFLNFQFDDLAFSFTETDCANPALMAHIRALKVEHLYQRRYEDGINDYLQLAIKLMKSKDFPAELIVNAISRYLGANEINNMRNKINTYALQAFNLSEEQLICMIYSPFVNQGANLKLYLQNEKPYLLHEYKKICEILSNRNVAEVDSLKKTLVSISGIELDNLTILYASSANGKNDQPTLINRILRDDPHKTVIKTRQSPNGELVEELLSGR